LSGKFTLQWTILVEQVELGFQLAAHLDDFWSEFGYLKEGLALMRQLLDLPHEVDPLVRAALFQSASDLAWQQHDFETAIVYSKEAAELGRALGLIGRYAAYINRLGRIYIEQGRYAEAAQTLKEVLELALQEPENMNPGIPLAQLGEIAFFEGRLDEAEELLNQSLIYLTESQLIFFSLAKTDLAEIALAHEDFSKARLWLVQACNPAAQHIRRGLVFLCALAGYLVLSSEDKNAHIKAAQFYGAIESWSERSGVILGSFYQGLNQKRIDLARKSLSQEEWQKAHKAGRAWGREEALEHARKDLN
jgi:tetratricopeptide (TPR) repeat protein